MKHHSFPPLRTRLALRGAAVAVALGCLVTAGQAQPAADVSAAERLVFTDPHLHNVRPPQTLRYRFSRAGALEPAFEDDVQVALRPGPKGRCCSASARFLTKERQLALPDIDHAEANPVILYFLEHDVREMQRLTKGQSSYFRKRLRLALVDKAQIRDTTVSWNGAEVPAREVRVRPYLDDPMRSRYERYAGKEYRFVLARDVPGGVYQIDTVVPGAQPNDAPALQDTMTLVESSSRAARPAPPSPGVAR